MEAILVQAGASAGAKLVRAGNGADTVTDDLHRRTLNNLVRLARAAVRNAHEQDEQDDDDYSPRRPTLAHPSLSDEQVERLLCELEASQDGHEKVPGRSAEGPGKTAGSL